MHKNGKSLEYLNSTIKDYATFLSINEEILKDNILPYIDKNCEIFDIDLEWKNNLINFFFFGLIKILKNIVTLDFINIQCHIGC